MDSSYVCQRSDKINETEHLRLNYYQVAIGTSDTAVDRVTRYFESASF